MTAEDKAPVEQTNSAMKEGEMPPPTYDEANPLTSGEPIVKITNNETKIDIGKDKDEYQGLTKEELMKYANDPFWVRLRWILFALFWIIWVAMLVASVVIIIYAPKCPSPEPKQWWQKNAMYKVEVEQFTDLAGVQDQLDYLVGSGVGTLYLTSFTKPTPSTGDGVLDYKTIDPAFGTLDNWKTLVEDLHMRNLKVVIDFIPNHGRDTDVDLNDPRVVKKLEDVMQFWISTGVNGFVINDVGQMVDDSPPLVGLIEKLREVVDAETEESGVPCVLIADSLPNPGDAAKYYGEDISGANVGSLFHLPLYAEQVNNPTSAAELKESIDDFSTSLPTNAWPSFAFSSTTNQDLVDAMTMVKMLLPGTPMFHSGEELGLSSWDQSKAQDNSHLAVFSDLASKLRHQESILFGDMVDATFVVDDHVFGLTRVKKGNPGYLLLINFGVNEMEVDISDVQYVPSAMRLMVKSVAEEAEDPEEVKRFETDKVLIKPNEGRVFTFVPDFSKDEN